MSEEKSPTKRVRELLEGHGIKYEDTDTTKELLRLHDRMNDAMLRYERALGTVHSKSDAVVPFVSEMHAIIEDAATLGRSCASCPEMDIPDSYISHLQAALRWHDEHVPRPTNPRNTCVVLKGENKPDEVLFIHDEGGVTHYLPEDEGTCRNIAELNRECVSGYFFVCSECGLAVHASLDIRETNYPRSKPDGSTDLRTFNSNGKYEFERCPRCGRKVTE